MAYEVTNVTKGRPPVIARFDVTLPFGWQACGCMVIRSPATGEVYVTVPRVPIFGEDGEVMRHTDRRIIYKPAIRFLSADEWRHFRNRVKDTLFREYPELFRPAPEPAEADEEQPEPAPDPEAVAAAAA